MKTAKILKKSVLTPGNNWISLLNSANLSKKNAVTPVNFHLYHYAGNNPVRYTDPDGRKIIGVLKFDIYMSESRDILGTQPNRTSDPRKIGSIIQSPDGEPIIKSDGQPLMYLPYLRINGYGCVLTAATRILSSIWCHRIKIEDVNKYVIEKGLFKLDVRDGQGDITLLYGNDFADVINGYLKDKLGYDGLRIEYLGEFKYSDLKDLDTDNNQYFVTCRIDGSHTVNIDRDYDSKFNKFPLNDTNEIRFNQYDYTKDTSYSVFVLQRKKEDGTYENLH